METKADQRRRYWSDPKKHRKMARDWYWKDDNRDKVRAYRKKHAEHYKLLNRKYNKKYRKKIGLRTQTWYMKNRERLLEQTRIRSQKLKLEVIKHYSPNMTCQWPRCNWSDIRALSIDHIHGGGNKHRREQGIIFNMYRWLKKNNFPKGYQILCMNHQRIKCHENREWGKGRTKINWAKEK